MIAWHALKRFVCLIGYNVNSSQLKKINTLFIINFRWIEGDLAEESESVLDVDCSS